ncbi:MAG: YedE family putative selenium transporter [Bryobacteraceae bacterium]
METETLLAPPPIEETLAENTLVENTLVEDGSWLRRHQDMLLITATGLAIGGLGVWLSFLGNPRNAGICISCFMENLAGALSLHGNARMEYVRPELIGFILGAAVMAFLAREFRSEGGSSPILRFLGGGILIVGCGVFMGCPIRMALRLGAGDFTAASGFVGLVAGVWLGFVFLKRGFYLGEASPMPLINGLILPLIAVGTLVAVLMKSPLLQSSASGPGAERAPFAIALGAGLLIGALAQRSRFCITGNIGNFLAARDYKMASGVLAMLGSAVIVSLLLGSFHPGFDAQPGSNLAYGWSFLGMGLVGITSVLIGGCPFRQVVLASQGSTDAAAAVLGMLGGAALVQTWSIGSTNVGPTPAGKIATLLSFAFILIMGLVLRMRESEQPA